MSSLGVLPRLPRRGTLCPHPHRQERVVWQMHAVISGALVLALARTWSRTLHLQVCPPLHPGAVSPAQPPVHTSRACTACGRPTPPWPAPPPGLPSGSPHLSSASLASTRARRWPQPREPWRRVQEEDLSDRGTPTGRQLWSLQLEEPQRPQRRRTRSRPDRRTRSLPSSRCLLGARCAVQVSRLGWARWGAGSFLRGWGRMLRPPERAIAR